MHKKPWKTQPVVSTCGTYLHALKWWVDFHLKQLTSLVPTYIQDSHQLLEELKQLGTLPVTAWLFTADAVSMYTNIDSTHALQVLCNILQENENQLPMNFPGDNLMDALQIVTDNNVLSLEMSTSNSAWAQLWVLQLHASMQHSITDRMKGNSY